jgi:ATP phosphoribosyltransferase
LTDEQGQDPQVVTGERDAGLVLAIPRGALFEEIAGLLDAAGVSTEGPRSDSRSLLFNSGEMTLITVRPSDVPTYVQSGAADLGITGKDVLAEQADREVVELLDLGVGACRMVLAAREGDRTPVEHERKLGMMRVATKYPNVTNAWFAERGRQVEIVEIKGSVELAPLVGLADAIVDLVATGRTLAENGLEVRDEIFESTARLIANDVSYRLKVNAIDEFTARLAGGVR